jgi:CheY-like chemotaxis protein
MDFTDAEQGNGIPRCVVPLPSLPRLAASLLIVGDEALGRVLAAGMFGDAGFRMFGDAGYRVLEAANSDEALEFLDADSDVQLLFTDVNLPRTIDGSSRRLMPAPVVARTLAGDDDPGVDCGGPMIGRRASDERNFSAFSFLADSRQGSAPAGE